MRLVSDISQMDQVQAGDVLETDMTDPNWEPVSEEGFGHRHQPLGGRTCHAAPSLRAGWSILPSWAAAARDRGICSKARHWFTRVLRGSGHRQDL